MALLMSTWLAVAAIAPACCGHGAASGRVEELVAKAWQEQAVQGQKIDKRHQADLDADTELGKKYSAEVEKELKVSKEKAMDERVQRLASKLADVARKNQVKVTWGDKRLNPFTYKFTVVEGKDVNAFSLPGGFIYIYEGLVKYAESDDELAGVIAHEIAHASFRHVATLQREASRLQVAQLPLILIAIFSGGKSGSIEALTLSQLIGQAKGSGWGQQAELASDFGGFQYMRLAGYNPVGMLTFMERLAREQRAVESIDWGIYRTHPPSRERADAFVKMLNDAEVPIRRSEVTTSFRVLQKESEGGKVDVSISGIKLYTFGGSDAKSRALEAAVRLNEFFDSLPELYDLKVTADGRVEGRRELLFQIAEADQPDGTSQTTLIAETLKQMRRAITSVTFRVWNLR